MSVGWPQTFALDLDLVDKALALYREESNASISEVSTRLGVGERKVKGLNSWLKYLGLRDPGARQLTPLAVLLCNNDPHLSDFGTLSVLHYELVSNPNATVWYETVNRFLAERSSFMQNDLPQYFEEVGIGQLTKHLKEDIRLFIRTYTDDHRRSLQGLGFLKKQGTEIRAGHVPDMHPLILGYCLFHRLERGVRESTTSISRLLEEAGGPGLAFRLTEESLLKQLAALESAGLISVVRVADIDGISYSFTGSPIDLLEQYFTLR